MKTYLKKILSIIICSFMFVSPLNISVFAQEQNPIEQTENNGDLTNIEETPIENPTSEDEQDALQEEQIPDIYYLTKEEIGIPADGMVDGVHSIVA